MVGGVAFDALAAGVATGVAAGVVNADFDADDAAGVAIIDGAVVDNAIVDDVDFDNNVNALSSLYSLLAL